jgi:hypothetical protein
MAERICRGVANDTEREWRLYSRAWQILEGRANGHALPIIRLLAARGFAPAITVLSDHVSEAEAIRLLRKAARRGDAGSAYNLAITYRNRGDLLNYRRALGHAARGDVEAAEEFRRFRLRFPEPVMRRLHRLAPGRGRR